MKTFKYFFVMLIVLSMVLVSGCEESKDDNKKGVEVPKYTGPAPGSTNVAINVIRVTNLPDTTGFTEGATVIMGGLGIGGWPGNWNEAEAGVSGKVLKDGVFHGHYNKIAHGKAMGTAEDLGVGDKIAMAHGLASFPWKGEWGDRTSFNQGPGSDGTYPPNPVNPWQWSDDKWGPTSGAFPGGDYYFKFVTDKTEDGKGIIDNLEFEIKAEHIGKVWDIVGVANGQNAWSWKLEEAAK